MTARHPAPSVANGGTVRRRDITTIEIKAAIAQGRMARDHSIPVDSSRALGGTGTVGGSREKTGRSAARTSPAPDGTKGSGMATRIWGAPHCEQKGLPSSLLLPHLWQG